MLLDLVLAISLVLAIIKGYQRGLIIGIFSFLAILIGLAAALRLSATVAGYIGKTTALSEQWLPIISFAAVFLIVIILVRLGANALEKTVEFAMLGWVNRMGGILFYSAICILILSVLLFYAEQMGFVTPATSSGSVCYAYVHPWGPRVIDAFGNFVPVFRDMFTDLQNFFGSIAKNVS